MPRRKKCTLATGHQVRRMHADAHHGAEADVVFSDDNCLATRPMPAPWGCVMAQRGVPPPPVCPCVPLWPCAHTSAQRATQGTRRPTGACSAQAPASHAPSRLQGPASPPSALGAFSLMHDSDDDEVGAFAHGISRKAPAKISAPSPAKAPARAPARALAKAPAKAPSQPAEHDTFDFDL